MEVKKQAVNKLKEGDKVDDIFFVKFKKGLKNYKSKEGSYFNLTLSDSSGNIEYTFWGDSQNSKVKELYDSLKEDMIVKVRGQVTVFNGKKQLTSNSYDDIKILKEGEYDEKDFIKPPRKDADEQYSRLLSVVNEVKNPQLRKLLEAVFTDENVIKSFKKMPGGIEIHHNWIGGLLDHTLEVLDYALLSSRQFSKLDKDLLITGALLHDIGKLEELKVTTRIRGTVKGQLLGHIVLGSIFVARKCEELGIDEELKNKVLHLIVSHHGKEEYGSPKGPMFPEALAVYYADELSSKLAEILEFKDKALEETEDRFKPKWPRKKARNILLR